MKRKCCFCIAVWFTSWPLNVFFNQSLSHGSIHSSCFNLGVVAPVGPVHFPNEWKVISLMSTQLKHSVHSSNSFLRYDCILRLPQTTYPLWGSTTIAWGSSIMPEIRVLRWRPPLIWATSITSLPESVQYKFPATQSTAMPRGIFRSGIWKQTRNWDCNKNL